MMVNKGPQKLRGNTSYISYILSCIDRGFRISMYNHNRIYLERSIHNIEIRNTRYIPKSCFSYKNIHMNLGKIRFYSTTNKFYSLQLKSEDNYSELGISPHGNSYGDFNIDSPFSNNVLFIPTDNFY